MSSALSLRSGMGLPDTARLLSWRVNARRVAVLGAYGVMMLVTAVSAILAKEARTAPAPLAGVTYQEQAGLLPVASAAEAPKAEWDATAIDPRYFVPATEPVARLAAERTLKNLPDAKTRWFNGRPVRPARTMSMLVTGYSPDARSCGPFADGMTATLHSVETNAMELVAADPKVLPYGSMVTVSGYADGHIVPVLDCGGKIKGKRLDLLYATHERAREWGVKKIDVVIWEYADGKPAENVRKER